MKSITLSTLNLPTSVGSKNLRQLRDDIVAIVGNENPMWHGHTEEGGYDYDYPLIQYRHNHILGIGAGADALLAAWMQHKETLGDVRLDLASHPLVVTAEPQEYYIHRWMPLNAENYARWKEMDTASRQQELERLLIAHILTFARAVDWFIGEEVISEVVQVLNVKKVNMMNRKTPDWEETNFVSFGVLFRTNVTLPLHIGLGRGVRLGNGVLEPQRHALRFVKNKVLEVFEK
jgi:hypothetical protein